MGRFSLLIAKYIFRSVVPYFVLSWLLLSVILFTQQAGRHADIFFNNSLPAGLLWQLTFALLPTVTAFTCPMAVLIGVIIGIAKMQGDGELVAIRAAGVSNLQVTLPLILLGVLLSAFAFTVNSKGVPLSAQLVRKIAAQAALYKLESPIEPGVFNTEVRGFTVYVKGGDVERGLWKNIFIHSKDKNSGQVRLITSENGRLDSRHDVTELVLEKALVSTFSGETPPQNLTAEKVENFRLTVETKRQELINKISLIAERPEELGLAELATYAESKQGAEKVEAQILWQRRIILSITPLIFALLGAALALRFNRDGKGFGISLALVSFVVYYLAALLGEQLARNGSLKVGVAGWLPVFLTSAATAGLFLSPKLLRRGALNVFPRRTKFGSDDKPRGSGSRKSFRIFAAGILDFDIVVGVLKYFLLAFGFLTAIFMIFTAFDLWRYAGAAENGTSLLLKYLFFLIPYVYIQISATALMVAMLTTYVIKARQNELVIWTASGQSVYRLLLPSFVLMGAIGFINWHIQERVLPRANQMQDALRSQLRNKGISNSDAGKYWVADENRIYSFELSPDEPSPKVSPKARNLTIFQFVGDGTKLESVIRTVEATWESGKIKFPAEVEKIVWLNDIPQTENVSLSRGELVESHNPFRQTNLKPTHLNAKETRGLLAEAESDSERRSLAVALQKKYSTPFLPFIITLFTAPFALSLSRKGKAVTVGYAVGIWLIFMGVNGAFEQFGLSGYVSAELAVWGPLALFLLLGSYLLTKVRT